MADSLLQTQVQPIITPLELRERVRFLRRRIAFFVAGLVLAVVIGGIVSMRAVRVYRATATVLIDVNAPDVLNGVHSVYDLGVGYWATKEYYQTQYNVIRSRVVAQQVASMLGLVPASLIAEIRQAPAPSTESRIAGDPLYDLTPALQTKLRTIGLGGQKTREQLIERLQNMDVVLILQKRVQVEPVKDSRLVQINIEDTDPAQAANMANAVADAYIEVNLDQKMEATRSAVNWLTDQMHDLKKKLETSELALHQFRKDNNIVSVSMEDRQTMISQTLTQLNQSLSTARADGFALQSRRDAIARVVKDGQLPDTFEEVISNALVQRLKSAFSDLSQEEADLRQRYTDEHPKLRALREKIALVRSDLQAEVNKIVEALSDKYDVSVDTQHRLEREIEKVKGEALELGAKEMDYSRFRRERDNNLELYDVVLKREKEASLTQMLKVNNVRKLDAARPPRNPVRPNVKMNMVVSLMLGVMLGLAMAFIVDNLDNTVKNQQQVEQTIGLPFLGIVPKVKLNKIGGANDAGERDMYIVSHPRSIPAECWRTIRTNIMFMTPDNPARLILVSSNGPREGKSTTAINLAVTMASLGTQTLLIDTDMRRPRLHKSFGMPNDVGLSSMILGEQSAAEAVRPTQVERLDLLTCGPIPPNPAELLHTEAFRTVFQDLSQRYERIIFDSPPVGAVTDALVLASMVDGVVLVVHAGDTTCPSALQARRRFEDVGSRLLGVVLNDVDMDKRVSGEYYEYRYYRYGYEEEA